MKDKNTEILNKLYQNAKTASHSIAHLISSVTDSDFSDELKRQNGIYVKISDEIAKELYTRNADPKNINFFDKTASYANVKFNLIKDNSLSGMAETMVQGTVMGITSLLKLCRRYGGVMDEETQQFATELLNHEEEFEKKLKTFI